MDNKKIFKKKADTKAETRKIFIEISKFLYSKAMEANPSEKYFIIVSENVIINSKNQVVLKFIINTTIEKSPSSDNYYISEYIVHYTLTKKKK